MLIQQHCIRHHFFSLEIFSILKQFFIIKIPLSSLSPTLASSNLIMSVAEQKDLRPSFKVKFTNFQHCKGRTLKQMGMAKAGEKNPSRSSTLLLLTCFGRKHVRGKIDCSRLLNFYFFKPGICDKSQKSVLKLVKRIEFLGLKIP